MKKLRRFLQTSFSTAVLALTGLTLDAGFPKAAQSTEVIRILVAGPLLFDLSVESLETFAATGEFTGDLANYARFIDPNTLELLRGGLNRKIPLDVTAVDHLAYSPLGRDTLYNLGKVFQTYRGVNGQKALRAALIGAAAQADADGWTLIDVLKAFPTDTLEVELEDLLALRRELSVYFSYNDAAIAAIQAQAQAEAANQPNFDFSELRDLSQPGTFAFTKQTITVTNPALRQTPQGLSVNYDFDADLYIPSGLTAPAPVVIVSHGFGDVKESFTFLAEHLVSYGFVVVVPDHVGSDLQYREEYLQGRLNTLLSPMEFINRPQELSFLIDTLEELVAGSSDWAAVLDLANIGVAGDSLGSTTALAIAGAEINYARLVESCNREEILLNSALYLECRAQHLPPQNYDLRDPRVKAVIIGHPLGAALYGPEGFGQIDIPLLMVAGSKDIVSPVVTEQLHPFIWLQNDPKYLALLDVGTHFSSKPGRDVTGFLRLIAGENRDVGTAYYKTLSVAFWNLYLREQEVYRPYLTAHYAEAVSMGQPMTLNVITSLTPEQLETAYGRPIPIPVVPPTIAEAVSPRADSILTEIAETGVLRVALRKDAPPFGFITPENAWDGYCGDVAIALSNYLTQTLDRSVDVEVAELTSTLTNRFDLVRDNNVHLECGPNTIRDDVNDIVFSNPFFAASTQFLVRAEGSDRINPNTPLNGIRLGVLSDSTTQQFVEETYPEAEIVSFTGIEGRKDAVAATANGEIDAFVSDGILSYAELLLERRATEGFELIPEVVPLTCDYYGLILPNDDPQWLTTINQFLVSDLENAVATQWFETLYPETLNKIEYCLNQ